MPLRPMSFLIALASAGLLLPPSAPIAEGQAAPPVQSKADPDMFGAKVAPLLANYCTKCHGGEKPKGKLTLDKYMDTATAAKDRKIWEKVAKKLRAGEMPPSGRPKPTQAEIDAITGWIDTEMTKVDCNQPKDPGRVTIRRLNRVEYNNTIRDLVGVDFRPADDFPSDDIGYGFDNIGDVLSMPPILVEKYLAAAERIVDKAFQDTAVRKRILIAEPAGTDAWTEPARRVLENFVRRAYRRPARPEEIDRLLRFIEAAQKDGENFESGIKLALQAVLVSPHFLFKVEADRNRNDPNAVWAISDYELATRLSYFLWSTMPDEELFEQAAKGTLRQNLDAQVRRMLADPKSQAFVESFAGQWLQVRNVKTATPDPKLFPTFDADLRTAMQRETELFFAHILKEDRGILEFLDADYTFVNERLAKHYEIPDVKGAEFRRVKLPDARRGGVLTQASILTITSNPTRTSPVKRGKWILENILGTPPPPPPPDAGELSEDKAITESASLRVRMEQHRSNPTCATCHQRMDPLGFGFENFDAIGAWRDKDGKFPIDPAGTLPNGESFKTPAELRAILKKKEAEFRRCLSEKILTYALGRGLEYYDKCAVDDITAAVARNGNRFTVLILEVAKSDPFQKRRAKRANE